MTGTDTFADNGAARVLADVYHLGAGVGFLMMVGDGHAVELGLRIVAGQDARRIFPGNGRAGLYLCPLELAARTA